MLWIVFRTLPYQCPTVSSPPSWQAAQTSSPRGKVTCSHWLSHRALSLGLELCADRNFPMQSDRGRECNSDTRILRCFNLKPLFCCKGERWLEQRSAVTAATAPPFPIPRWPTLCCPSVIPWSHHDFKTQIKRSTQIINPKTKSRGNRIGKRQHKKPDCHLTPRFPMFTDHYLIKMSLKTPSLTFISPNSFDSFPSAQDGWEHHSS